MLLGVLLPAIPRSVLTCSLVLGAVGAIFVAASLPVADTVVVHVVAYDREGTPLFATDDRAALALERSAKVALRGPTHPSPGPLTFEAGAVEGGSADLRRPLRSFVAAARAAGIGGQIETPLLERPYGSWRETISIPRIRGPFQMENTFPLEAFKAKYGAPVMGDVVELSVLANVPAQVVKVTQDSVVLRNLLQPGDVIEIERLDFPARVLIEEGGREFTLSLDPPSDHVFGFASNCVNPIFTLSPGSYRVDGSSPTEIRLSKADVVYPFLVERDVRFVVTTLALGKSTPIQLVS